jgi:hypothetical protein
MMAIRRMGGIGLTALLSACATVAPPSAPTAPEITRSLTLRDRYGVPHPQGIATIYIDSVAVHHTRAEGSTIAWKDAAGVWHWSQVSETGPGGMLPIERKMDYNRDRLLSASDAQALDALIRNPALYSGKVKLTGEPGIGAPYRVMEILSPKGHVILRWEARLVGPPGAVADILLGG